LSCLISSMLVRWVRLNQSLICSDLCPTLTLVEIQDATYCRRPWPSSGGYDVLKYIIGGQFSNNSGGSVDLNAGGAFYRSTWRNNFSFGIDVWNAAQNKLRLQELLGVSNPNINIIILDSLYTLWMMAEVGILTPSFAILPYISL